MAKRPKPARVPVLEGIHKGLEDRRQEIARDAAIAGRLHLVYGFFRVEKSGEAMWEEHFPVAFVDRPVMGFGFELFPNQAVEDGNFPQVSVGIKDWFVKERDDGAGTYYIGARFIATVLGHEEMRTLVHWSVQGVALRNPLAELGTTDDEI